MPASLAQIRRHISQLLNISGVQQILQLNSNTPERAFEAYVFSLCKMAVANQGGATEIRGINSGSSPNPMVFRGGPGSMYSTNQDYCFAHCQLRSKTFEIHVDVEYEGQSGVTHEVDISICDHDHAEKSRGDREDPRGNKPLKIAIECKFYSSRPGVGLARTFIGLTSDFPSSEMEAFCSNKNTPDLDRFLSRKRSPEPFTDLTPLDQNAEDRFVRYLEQVLKKWSAS